jgi:ATP-binding cassette subfamily B protein
MPMSAVDEDSKLDRREAAQVLRRAARMLRPYKRDVVGAGVLVTISTLAVLAGPFLLKVGIDRGITGGNEAVLDLAVAAFVVVAVIAYVASRVQILMISRSGEGFLRDLRNRVFDHLLRLSMPFYDREKAGVVVSRMTSDVDSLQELIQQGLLQMLASILLIVGSVIVLGIVCWQLLLVCLIPVPFVVLASIKFQRDSNEAYLTVRDRIGLTLSSLQEGISGVRVIQAYGREDVEIGAVRPAQPGPLRGHMRSVKLQAWYLPVIEGARWPAPPWSWGSAATWWPTARSRSARSPSSCSPSPTCSSPSSSSPSCSTPCSPRAPRCNKLFDLLDTPPDLAEAPDAVDPARPRRAARRNTSRSPTARADPS